MSEFNIEVQGGSSVRLPTAGKYCDRDIIVTASGGGGGTEEIENLIDESKVLGTTDGTATEKVEQLIDKSADENLWYEVSKTWASYQDRFRNAPIKKLPRLSFENATNFTNMCTKSSIETFDYYISNTKTVTTYNYMFQQCVNLKFVKGLDVSQTVNFASVFEGCASLETIQEPLNLSSATTISNTFVNCKALKNISFVTETIINNIGFPNSVNLSAESKQSIFDGLAKVTTAKTLTLHKDAKILQSQVDNANAKGWTVVGGTVVSEEEYYG